MRKANGYNQPEHAVKRHCKGCTFHTLLTAGGSQRKKYIPEGDLYRLLIRLKLPEAEQFEVWVCKKSSPQSAATERISQKTHIHFSNNLYITFEQAPSEPYQLSAKKINVSFGVFAYLSGKFGRCIRGNIQDF